MWGWWALFWTLNFQVPVGQSSRDSPGSGMCKSEAQEWGLASSQTSWVLSSSSGQDSTFLGFGHTPSGGTTAAVWMATFKDFKAKFTQRSWLILTRMYLGADTPPIHSQMQWELQLAESVTGHESNSSPHTLPTSPRMGSQWALLTTALNRVSNTNKIYISCSPQCSRQKRCQKPGRSFPNFINSWQNVYSMDTQKLARRDNISTCKGHLLQFAFWNTIQFLYFNIIPKFFKIEN